MVNVKVCGITRAADAELAADLGAAAVGFIFWPRSPRYIEPPAAAAIVRTLAGGVAPVGVFVNPTRDEVREVAATVGLATVQLHGDEPATLCAGLPYDVWKAVPVDSDPKGTCARVDQVPEDVTVLLDASDHTRRGGTGRTIDWTVAATVASNRRIMLAGGLAPENVGAALEMVRPFGVDVSSGVEESPGRKNPDRLRAFFDAVRAAEQPAGDGMPVERLRALEDPR